MPNSYKLNNIDFRIMSADAISKFRQLQSTTFLQLARPELNFHISTREIVLLEFDFFSSWLVELESILKFTDDNKLTADIMQTIRHVFDEKIISIEQTLLDHPNVFDTKLIDFIKTIHRYCFELNSILSPIELSAFKDNLHGTTGAIFDGAAQFISDYLQHVLVCCHEYNSNIISNIFPPFVSLDKFNPFETQLGPHAAVIERAKFFKANGCGSKYVLKTYVDIIDYEETLKDANALALLSGIELLKEKM